MVTNALVYLPLKAYSLGLIRDEVRQLVEKKLLNRQQTLYSLCQYIPAREWVYVEAELEQADYLLRDRIADFLGAEKWDND